SQAKHAYRSHIKAVKQAYIEQQLMARVEEWARNPAQFWREYKAEHGNKVSLGVQHWTEYFRGVMGRTPHRSTTLEQHCAQHQSLFPHADEEIRSGAEELNRPITEGEVLEALKHLANNKSAGVDGIPAELLTHDREPGVPIDVAIRALLRPVTHTFNKVFTGQYPASWATCTLTPVYKGKGNPQECNNYRGIAVSTALAKLFSLVVLTRMDNWAEATGRRAAGQAGFRKGRNTEDGVFVLQHSIEVSKANQGPDKRLYVAFIDFEKAYDSVDRDLLWRVIEGMGVHGTMLQCLKNMHAAIMLQVKENGELGESFKAELGVKQGDPLSPLLFVLLIDRLEGYLERECRGKGLEVAGALLQALLYADDLALLSMDPDGLQELLDALGRFADANYLTVNLAKCKCVTFNKGQGRYRENGRFTYKGQAVDNADSFVYLGTTFWSNDLGKRAEARSHIQKNIGIRVGKARAALAAMRQRCSELDIHNVHLRCNLFKSLVAPVLASGSEVWGVYELSGLLSDGKRWGMDCEAERFQRSFLRWAFGMLPNSVDSLVLLQEARLEPLVHGWIQQLLSWYNKVLKRPVVDLVRRCLLDSLSRQDDSWGSHFLTLLGNIDASSAERVRASRDVKVDTLKACLRDRWKATWPDVAPYAGQDVRSVTVSEHIKFITYNKWFVTASLDKKHRFTYHLLGPKEIRAVATFRMSAHQLAIEKGRHGRVPRAARVCRCCESGIREDELHVFECSRYSSLRRKHCFTEPASGGDAEVQALMNPGDSAAGWKRLACYLMDVFALRAVHLGDD
ncbi:MAG: RNA-directed DNA polymerase, partial [bacterium]